MRSQLLFYSITSALAGFLFGFDTVVISGAEKTIQELWKLNNQLHGLAMSSALWGTVLGSAIGGWPSEKYGRKKTLLWIGVLYFVSAVWSGLATDVYSFMIARFIGGVGVGISTVAAPMYISEIAPARYRGRLAGMFQFNIVFGILMAFLSNALLANVGENAWRWMLGVEAFPALIYTVMTIFVPESPRWLLGHAGDVEKARAILHQLDTSRTADDVDQEMQQILTSYQQESATTPGFWTRRLSKPILLAFLIAFFNQLSGINAILYYAKRLLQMSGLGEEAALQQAVYIGVTNLIFTFVGLFLIDKLGRKTLLIIGSFGYIASLGLCSWAFYAGFEKIVPACIFAFIAAHAVGQGAVIWVFIAEIFPNEHRASGQALGSFTHWIFAALLTMVFPVMVANMTPWSIFAFFAFMMFLQLIWVLTMVPETKGVPLEEIQKRLGLSERRSAKL